MEVSELERRLGGEIVGGRLIAVVDGKRAYLTTPTGQLNELGLRMANELTATPEATEPEPAPAPRRGRRRAEPAAEPEIELDPGE